MQPGQPFDSPDPWSSPTAARPGGRKGLIIALICAAVVALGILNAGTGCISKALGLGPRPPISFEPNLMAVQGGKMVVMDIRAVDARGKTVSNPAGYLRRPRVEILGEDAQLLANIRLEAG